MITELASRADVDAKRPDLSSLLVPRREEFLKFFFLSSSMDKYRRQKSIYTFNGRDPGNCDIIVPLIKLRQNLCHEMTSSIESQTQTYLDRRSGRVKAKKKKKGKRVSVFRRIESTLLAALLGYRWAHLLVSDPYLRGQYRWCVTRKNYNFFPKKNMSTTGIAHCVHLPAPAKPTAPRALLILPVPPVIQYFFHQWYR